MNKKPLFRREVKLMQNDFVIDKFFILPEMKNSYY